ncbi:hypothetical protein LUZ60_013616 [Juncus effusus]|nr:hypothetical protein LUZ60_013616 [Juncus effusus]
MSGAQGAEPKGNLTATTYQTSQESTTSDRPRMAVRSDEDEKGIPVEKLEDKVENPAGKGGPVFGAGTEDKFDLGVTGTG